MPHRADAAELLDVYVDELTWADSADRCLSTPARPRGWWFRPSKSTARQEAGSRSRGTTKDGGRVDHDQGAAAHGAIDFPRHARRARAAQHGDDLRPDAAFPGHFSSIPFRCRQSIRHCFVRHQLTQHFQHLSSLLGDHKASRLRHCRSVRSASDERACDCLPTNGSQADRALRPRPFVYSGARLSTRPRQPSSAVSSRPLRHRIFAASSPQASRPAPSSRTQYRTHSGSANAATT
jgi:hypothetical protein